MMVVGNLHAETETEDDYDEEDALERMVVTGSRIQRIDQETVDPVYVLSSEEIDRQGFANAFDVLSNLSINTGMFIGEEVTNNFLANAQSLNLRGFGPGYTLVLLNGRRIPVLPKPAGTVSGNVVNLAMIPSTAIERVEVLSSGASAIYGSDAVAGVVNIILKDNVDGMELTYRYGDNWHGGGQSHRFSLVSGLGNDTTRFTYGLEVDRRRPIRGDQRDWFDRPELSPDPEQRELSQVMSYWDRTADWDLLDIGDMCEPLGYSSVRPGWAGEGPEQYCGDNIFGTYTVRNARDRLFGFASLSHEMGMHEVYADLLATRSEADAGLYRYSFGVDYQVVDDIDAEAPQTVGWRHVWRSFRDHEVPTSQQEFSETNLVLSLGIQGFIGEYDYGLNYTAGRYQYKDSVGRFNDEAMLSLLFGQKGEDWFHPWEGSRWVRVGEQQLSQDLLPTRFDLFGELTPEMFSEALHESSGDGRSTTQSLSADLTGAAFSLPAGDVHFAAVAEASRDTYRFITDQPTVDGEIWGWSGIRGSGSRNRYAIGGELAVPLLERDSRIGQWDMKLAARYDYYDDASDVGGAMTYQAGVSWRPTDSLMFRASRATSFRAPDMHVMFAERSSSFTSGVDYLQCVNEEGLTRGESWQGCGELYGTGSIRQFSEGDPSLREESGTNVNIGMVGDIGNNHSFTVDYFRIKLEDQIGLIGANTVLRYYAECMLGFDEEGRDSDASSPRCQAMLDRVTRGGPNDEVSSVITSPFNTGLRQQDGVDATWRSNFNTENLGRFSLNVSYTHILRTLDRFLPEDDIEDIRDRLWNTEFRTRTNVTLGWSGGKLGTFMHINRLGSSPVRYAEEYERHSPWTTVNLTTNYQVSDSLYFGVNVVNLFDKTPPRHETEAWWPYADIRKYNPVGREYFLTVGYRL
ncbi:TonB-dependent receptor [Wenzhouxiangella sp. AB-CW3]|uniref:TonB-dependent receptor plug domain-containing protein n=1 Tax=Wenzhouxiangella sp. AB-CW3 TaxID=2771012 RepID=UPI00168B826C|nr:TonB-dependent receptor [Wenzhouxiangella sp. AB-CW3]QOC21964.1 TonB-dependent receptor [Wenzhouxiangella sp. AB-CW3]